MVLVWGECCQGNGTRRFRQPWVPATSTIDALPSERHGPRVTHEGQSLTATALHQQGPDQLDDFGHDGTLLDAAKLYKSETRPIH